MKAVLNSSCRHAACVVQAVPGGMRRFPCQALGVCKRNEGVTMQRDGILVVEVQTVGEGNGGPLLPRSVCA